MTNPTRALSRMYAIFKTLRIFLHLCYGAWQAVWYPVLNPRVQRYLLKTWSRELLEILDIRIVLDGNYRPNHGIGCLLVSNHISWLDIFVINAVHPTRFIAKSEVKGWPVIGWLCQRTGTHFVERKQKRDAAGANTRLARILKDGDSIGLFPEGTTTDGSHVAPFHGTMLQPALNAGAPIYPIGLRYLNQYHQPNREVIFTGDTSLVASLWNVLSSRSHIAAITFIDFDSAVYGDRKSLANAAREVIAEHLRQPHPKQTNPLPAQAKPHAETVGVTYGLLLDPVARPQSD